jgi:fimbrial chaperone protein
MALGPRRPPKRLPRVKTAVVAAALLALTALPLFSVSVSPMAVYLTDRSRDGTITLYNPGSRPEEIRVELAFGYPQTDAEGHVQVPLTPEAPAGEPSAVPWLSVFPRRLVLEPGQRQVVRILARPPAGLEEGEYWGRALIRSRGGQAPIEARSGDVGVQLDVETVVVVAVNYRNGRVVTGLVVDEASARVDGDSTVARIALTRTGNAAFLGRLLVEALAADGAVLSSSEQVLAVYRSMAPRVSLPTPGDGARPVRVRYTLDTRRDDLPPGGALPVERIVHEVSLP